MLDSKDAQRLMLEVGGLESVVCLWAICLPRDCGKVLEQYAHYLIQCADSV